MPKGKGKKKSTENIEKEIVKSVEDGIKKSQLSGEGKKPAALAEIKPVPKYSDDAKLIATASIFAGLVARNQASFETNIELAKHILADHLLNEGGE